MSNEIEEKKEEKTNSICLSDGKFSFNSYSDILLFCSKISKTDLIPNQYKNKADDMAVAISMGMEIGLNPLQSLRGIAVVNGTATLYGDAMMAIVKKSGLIEYEEVEFNGEEDNLICKYSIKRKGEEKPVVREFSIKDAKRAKLDDKQPWKSYPKRMLMHRARTFALRDCFPDILGGLHSYEEIRDEPMINVTPQEKTINEKIINLEEFETDTDFTKEQQ